MLGEEENQHLVTGLTRCHPLSYINDYDLNMFVDQGRSSELPLFMFIACFERKKRCLETNYPQDQCDFRVTWVGAWILRVSQSGFKIFGLRVIMEHS